MNPNEVKAEDLMNTDYETVTTSDSLASIKNLMEEENLRAVPVVDDKGRVKGAVGYRDLIRYIQFNPDTTNLDKVMHQPPEFGTEDTLVDLADLRINSGRKMLVSTAGNKLKGVVSDREFADALKDAEPLKDISTRDVCAFELKTVFEEDSIDKVRHLMMDENISRLPVLDNNGNMTGIVKSTDLLKTLVPREVMKSGGTAGNRTGGEVYIAGGGEKNKLSEVPVSEVMERIVNTAEDHMTGDEAVSQMIDKDAYEIVFVDENYPETIVTLKDFIDHVAGMAPGKTVLVNLIGIELPEEKAVIHNKIRTQLQGSLGRKLERAEELDIHIKKADKDGTKHRYDAEVRLHSEYGLTKVSSDGWDLLEVVDESLNELNKIIRKEKEKREDRR